MEETLVLKPKHKYLNSIELIFEIADTSLLCFKIDEFLETYLSEQRKKLNDNEFNIEHELLIKKDRLSSGYSVRICSDIFGQEKLSSHSCDIRKRILSIPDFQDIILVTKDEGNCYLCERLYPKIMNIEIRLRAIVNIIYMQTNGNEWEKELKAKTKRANNKRGSGFDLNEILLETLIDLIFKINFNEGNEPPLNLETLSKSELIETINRVKYKSFWQEVFPNIDLKIEWLNLLMDIRNNVMHFKPLDYNTDYLANMKNCDKIILLLNKAEKQIRDKKLKLTKELVNSFNLLFQTVAKLVELMQPSFNQMATSLQPIRETIYEITNKINNKDKGEK